MGTRCLTQFMEDDKVFSTMYRQMDGYPDGHGLELAQFLDGVEIVNGFGMGDLSKQMNGMGCLAAFVIAHFKTEIGHIYIYHPDTTDVWENYIYRISAVDNKKAKQKDVPGQRVQIQVFEAYHEDENKEIFIGSPAEYIAWQNEEQKKEA